MLIRRTIIIFVTLFVVLQPSSAKDIEKIDLNTKAEQSTGVTSLQELIQEATAKNPLLLSLGYQITAQSARASWIKVLPDPLFYNTTETTDAPFKYNTVGKDGENQVHFDLGQQIPYPGKLKLKGRVETSELEKIRQGYDLTKLEIISRLKIAYYNLFFTTRSLEITQEVKKLLEVLAGTVKAKYEVGEGGQQDLLKIHLEISKLLEQVEILKKDRESLITEINSIVIRPQDTDIVELEEVAKQSVSYKLTDLLALSKDEYPLLLQEKALIEKSQYGIKLAKKEYFPDFNIRAGYVLRTDPMYTVQLVSSLPVFYRLKQRKQVEEAQASLKAAEENYHSILVEAERKIKDLYIQIEKNDTLIDLLQTGIIPQAKLTFDASIAAYKVDKTDFLNVLDNIRALLGFQIDYYGKLTAYEKAIAELEPLIGREL